MIVVYIFTSFTPTTAERSPTLKSYAMWKHISMCSLFKVHTNYVLWSEWNVLMMCVWLHACNRYSSGSKFLKDYLNKILTSLFESKGLSKSWFYQRKIQEDICSGGSWKCQNLKIPNEKFCQKIPKINTKIPKPENAKLLFVLIWFNFFLNWSVLIWKIHTMHLCYSIVTCK